MRVEEKEREAKALDLLKDDIAYSYRVRMYCILVADNDLSGCYLFPEGIWST